MDFNQLQYKKSKNETKEKYNKRGDYSRMSKLEKGWIEMALNTDS